jgi:ABC-type transport system involved in multi-copper enzyme maturation permease subunit
VVENDSVRRSVFCQVQIPNAENSSLIGPIFTREAAVAPRRIWFFAARSVFCAALFALALTSWQLLVGSQRVDNLGDLAWFGTTAFQILAPLQLAVALPFAAVLVASAVSLEKDRKTLDLLLLTRLSNVELVLGKLLAALLTVLVTVAAALPLLMIISLLGGISTSQILRVQAVTLSAALVAGSLGSTIALWREKTFQSLAMSVLVIALWLAAWEIIAAGALGAAWLGVRVETWAVAMSPWQAILAATQPQFGLTAVNNLLADPVVLFLIAAAALTLVLNCLAIVRVRKWNPPREVQPRTDEPAEVLASGSAAKAPPAAIAHGAGGKVRPVWNNPILWREVRTWAYGKKILVIHLVYLAVFLLCATALVSAAANLTMSPADVIPLAAKPISALLVVSVILLNTLTVTSLTGERDNRALDLLLVTDLTPKEIVFGKLGGALFNAKEMIVLPLVLCFYLWFVEQLTTENLCFMVGGMGVMYAFAAVLGLHAGITYANSRTAIAVSIGTLIFLFLGVATCMRIMLAFSNSFSSQMFPFLGFIAGGGIGLYVALGWRNPSRAIFWASAVTPIATFYVITSYLLGNYGGVFLVAALTYGFATWSMLLPAISEFDVATGRTSARED